MTPTREQIEAARDDLELVLDSKVALAHLSPGETASLRLLLAATALPTDEVELDRSAIFRAAEDAYHNGPQGNRREGERKRLAGEAIIIAVLAACGKRERTAGARREGRLDNAGPSGKRQTCRARDGECKWTECPQKTNEQPICVLARREGRR